MSCSAAEIAEKRRIALEKLQAKKQQTQIVTNVSKQNQKTETNINGNQGDRLANNGSYTVNGRTTFKTNTPKTQTPENSFKLALEALKKNIKFPRAVPVPTPYERPQPKTSSNNVPVTSHSAEPQKSMAPVFYNAVSCKLFMSSQNCFTVQPSGFHSKLIDVFKTIPSRRYDTDTRLWSFSLKDYDILQERVGGLKPQVTIGSIPKSVINLCLTTLREQDASCLMSIEQTLVEKLLAFQKEAVCFAIAQQGRLMICDEMGLGKTYQAIAIADFYKEDWPLLICTTATTRDPWAAYIRELLPSIPVHYIQVLSSNQQYIGDAKVLITSYNMMERHMSMLIERKFGFLIFDESHTLKNSKAKCTMVADRLARKAKRIILLSGTPALSRPVELFSQLHMIDRKFMNFMEFTSRYCDGKQTTFGWDANGQSNLQELNVILKLKFMIRRTKNEVLYELSEKTRETVVLDPALIWHSDESEEKLGQFAKDFSISKGRDREEILLRFYQITAEVKSRAVCAYLKTLVKEKIKFIVFAHHRIMLDAISECFIKLGLDFIRIDGSTRNDLRADFINHFQNSSKCRAAVLSLRACNAGITLTAAEMIVFAELDWNPSTLAQAESRAHRIGQDKPIICRYLMASKTADDVIWNMLKNKQDVLNRAGIFCDNLQEATVTAAPISANTIDHYFSPNKSRSNLNSDSSKSVGTPSTPSTPIDTEKRITSKNNDNNNFYNKNTSKQLTLDDSLEFLIQNTSIPHFYSNNNNTNNTVNNNSSTIKNYNNTNMSKKNVNNNCSNKEIDNIEQFFEDDDDAFNEINF